jgi:peroxiredoxin
VPTPHSEPLGQIVIPEPFAVNRLYRLLTRAGDCLNVAARRLITACGSAYFGCQVPCAAALPAFNFTKATLAGMAIESTMLALGTPAPSFSLPEPGTGATVSLDDLTGPALVVTFICNHCPYVQHVAAGLAALGRDLADQGVAMVGISSNDVVTYPQDGPEQMVAEARKHGWTFPYLYDETQDVARAFSAACTPDTFVFDGERRLVYRGQLDNSRPGNDLPVTAADVRSAVDAVLAGQPVDADQRPSIGCGIKWR